MKKLFLILCIYVSFSGIEAEDVHAALLLADGVGELAVAPLLEGDDRGAVLGEDFLHVGDGAGEQAQGRELFALQRPPLGGQAFRLQPAAVQRRRGLLAPCPHG